MIDTVFRIARFLLGEFGRPPLSIGAADVPESTATSVDVEEQTPAPQMRKAA